jgi:hypothetical protein
MIKIKQQNIFFGHQAPRQHLQKESGINENSACEILLKHDMP